MLNIQQSVTVVDESHMRVPVHARTFKVEPLTVKTAKNLTGYGSFSKPVKGGGTFAKVCKVSTLRKLIDRRNLDAFNSKLILFLRESKSDRRCPPTTRPHRYFYGGAGHGLGAKVSRSSMKFF